MTEAAISPDDTINTLEPDPVAPPFVVVVKNPVVVWNPEVTAATPEVAEAVANPEVPIEPDVTDVELIGRFGKAAQ